MQQNPDGMGCLSDKDEVPRVERPVSNREDDKDQDSIQAFSPCLFSFRSNDGNVNSTRQEKVIGTLRRGVNSCDFAYFLHAPNPPCDTASAGRRGVGGG